MAAPLLPFGPPTVEPLPAAHTHGYSVQSFHKKCVDSHWHFHPALELTYITEGQGVFHCGQSFSPYYSGDLYLLGSNLPHAYSSHPEKRIGASWTVMHFLPTHWGENFWQLPQNQRIVNVLHLALRGLRFRGSNVPRCVDLLHRLENMSSEDVGMAIWIELLERLARLKPQAFLNAAPQKESPLWIDPRLRQVLTLIDNQFESSDLTQAEVARKIGLSPQAFCRFFRQGTGRSFHRYVNELRIAHACAALIHSKKLISDICFHTGFNNLANFNRRFRECVGQTPSQYRHSRGGY